MLTVLDVGKFKMKAVLVSGEVLLSESKVAPFGCMLEWQKGQVRITPGSFIKAKIGGVQWLTPVIPPLWKAEGGGLPDVRSLRPAWHGKTPSLLKI